MHRPAFIILLLALLQAGCDSDGYFILSNCAQFKEVEMQANKGSAKARLEMARRLADGDCIDKSKVDALMWLRLIQTQAYTMGEFAEDGAYLGQTNLKLMEFLAEVSALEGELRAELTPAGIAEAIEKADNWVTPEHDRLKQLAETGDAAAQYELAMLYFRHDSNLPYAGGIPYLAMAAEQGHPDAAYRMGRHYGDGKYVELDPEKAFELFQVAAEAGHYMGRNSLLLAYCNGEGVEQDLVECYKWLSIDHSYDKDYPDTMERYWRENVYDVLSEDQRRVAEEAARQWVAAHPQADIRR
ncbi:MAG: tetratricopeptide repeat protein [Gammaproteobacteria bacterium]|nr:tetratricopeptide repeat protein [Gammaproteobacteria bacterium]